MTLTTIEWVVLYAAVLVGSTVQGSLGFGLNVVVTPIAALVDPRLVPAPLLLLGTVHVMALGWTERRELRLRPVAWVLAGRVPGVVIAVLLLTAVTRATIELLFGVMLLAVTGLSLLRRGIVPNRTTLFGAGVVSGITGTTVSVGGPPVALVLAGSDRARADITSVIVLGTATSLGALMIAGEFDTTDARIAIALFPPLLLGFAVSRLVVGRLDPTHTRIAVYGVAVLAAVVLLLRGIF